jgi:hypothetical protein
LTAHNGPSACALHQLALARPERLGLNLHT